LCQQGGELFQVKAGGACNNNQQDDGEIPANIHKLISFRERCIGVVDQCKSSHRLTAAFPKTSLCGLGVQVCNNGPLTGSHFSSQ